ncbi:hypothetical protein [Caulobacter sp. X]|nr:hypothetical protein [Caulobacter sp. X]
MRRAVRLLSDIWSSLLFIVTIRAAAKPCRSRRVPPAPTEPCADRAVQVL